MKTIKTIFIHEFAHAISFQYEIFKDNRIQEMYKENNTTGIFKDIHEFIAECFVVDEYFPLNQVAMNVKKVADEYNQKAIEILRES